MQAMDAIDSTPNEEALAPLDTLIVCECPHLSHDDRPSVDVGFAKNRSKYLSTKNDSLFRLWSSDSLAKTVTSIRLSHYDTIPEKFKVFSNVEKVVLSSTKGVEGLDIFPKLKVLHFFAAQVSLKKKAKWMGRIEALFAQKSHILDLESFMPFTDLRILQVSHSGFKPFPSDLEALSCLNRITLGAYMFFKADLTQWDLSLMPCLSRVRLLSWHDGFIGIPKGLDSPHLKSVSISHNLLTEEEKEELKALK